MAVVLLIFFQLISVKFRIVCSSYQTSNVKGCVLVLSTTNEIMNFMIRVSHSKLTSAQPWLHLLLLVQVFFVANKFGNYLPLSVSFVLLNFGGAIHGVRTVLRRIFKIVCHARFL